MDRMRAGRTGNRRVGSICVGMNERVPANSLFLHSLYITHCVSISSGDRGHRIYNKCTHVKGHTSTHAHTVHGCRLYRA